MISTEAKIFLLALGGGVVVVFGVLAGFMSPAEIRDFVLGFGGNILASLVGVLAGFFLWDGYINPHRYGGSTVRVLWNGREILSNPISWRKTKEMIDDDAERSVFLKGNVSPYMWLNCDLLREGCDNGMLVIEETPQFAFGRRFDYTITLDHNPPGDNRPTWRLVMLHDGEEVGNIALSPATMKGLREDDPETWSFFVEQAAPYAAISADSAAAALDIGLLRVSDNETMRVTLDLDRATAVAAEAP